jgi:hypothetical protein
MTDYSAFQDPSLTSTPNNADPFSGGSASPDAWRNLMQFGLATMAAGAKPGATTMGALGQGGLAATESARQNAAARSQQQLIGSEAAKNNLGNQLQLLGINSYRQHMGQNPYQIGPNGQLIQSPQQQQAAMDNTQQISASAPASTTVSNPQAGPQQSSGMAGQTWAPSLASSGGSNQPKTNSYPSDPFAAPPGVDSGQWNQAVQAQMMGLPFGGELSKYALAGPQAELEAAARGRHPTSIEARPGGIAYNPDLGITATGRVDGETSGGAKYLTAPSITGGGVNIGGPAQTERPPSLNSVTGAATGMAAPMQASELSAPTAPGYSGVPQGAVLTDIGPGANEQIKNEMEFHTNGEHGELKSYNASVGSKQNLTQLQSYLDTLNAHQGDPNFLASGSGAETRTDIAKLGNTAWSMAGGDPKNAPFDPDKLSAAQAAYKTANLLGMQLINSQFGASREAASVIQTGLKSVPSMENTPQGAQLLLNGAKEVSNNTIDRYTFKEWWAGKDGPQPGDLRGADVAFNKMFPPQAYAQRAISQDQPINVTGIQQPKLLPGTKIIYNGQIGTFKPPVNYPFELPSINGQQ